MPATDSADSDQRGLVPEYRMPILASSPDAEAPDGSGGSRDRREPARPARPDKLPGWTPLLALASAVTMLGAALPFGFNIGVINTPAAIIKPFCNGSVMAHYDVHLTTNQLDLLWSAVVSVFVVGGMAGAMSGGWAADRLGRKRALALSMALSLAGALLLLCCRYANSIEMLLLGRVVVGLAAGLATSVMPLYLLELAPVHMSGALGSVFTLGINAGVFFSQLVSLDWLLGTEEAWHFLLALFGPPVLLGLLVLPALPESPKYLFLVREDEDLAVRELCRIRRLPESRLGDEVRALRMAVKSAGDGQGADDGQEWTFTRVLRSPDLLLPLVLVVALQAGQQLSGINAVFYYSSMVFRTAGLDPTQAQYATLGCGFINLMTAGLALKLVNASPRRTLMLTSISVAVLSLSLLAVSIFTIKSLPWMAFVAVGSVLVYVLFYGFGLGPIPFFIASELFDFGLRPIGMAIGGVANWTGNFTVGMSFTVIQAAIGPASFLIFAAILTLEGILLKMYLPETKGRDPTEVANMLRLGFKSKILKNVKKTQSSSQHDTSSETP